METQPIISKEDMAKLLGRSLSTAETNAYQTYLDIAVIRIKDLLCLEELPQTLPLDFQLLLARGFATIGAENSTETGNVSSKKVEDFSINYDTNSKETPMSSFVRENSATIAKYSACKSTIRSGERIYGDCLYCI